MRCPSSATRSTPLAGAIRAVARDIYVAGREHEELYQLAEALVELDESAQTWRIRHYRVVSRIIGDAVVGTQGTPVEAPGDWCKRSRFPSCGVWNDLTALSKESS